MVDMRIPSSPPRQVHHSRPPETVPLRPQPSHGQSFIDLTARQARPPELTGVSRTLPRAEKTVPAGAFLREVRLEPGPHPRIHLTIVHPVHHEVQITLVSLPTGIHIEVRCARPERLASAWPRMSRRHRVRFVRTTCGGPAHARRQPAT